MTVRAGDLVALTQEAEPQVVLLHAWSTVNPREHIWCNETSSLEDCFLVEGSRLWSTMPWFRTMLTVVEDRVALGPEPGRHHFVLDGWETPAAWIADGGDPVIPSAWDRFTTLLQQHGADPQTHRDHVALFRKVAIDPSTQRIAFPLSDARAGDRMVLYAELDLCLALVPSPFRGGGVPARELDGAVAPVRVETWATGVAPMGWPYPGLPYPDIQPYLDALEASY
jgi:uncharacterized protein YcgI (DUF1989 family)